MNTIAHHDLLYRHTATHTKRHSVSLWTQFINYATNQQPNRMLWLAIGLVGHGCIFTVATLAVVVLTGNVFALYAIACFPMGLVLVVNLAALPTKIIIPVFFLSILIDIGVIIAAIAMQ
ncbi:MAG TPA: hypothetical protein VKH37_02590 [Ferruginibacter sp.]|nr:hypothetical protein [Ferruginibacter sp.]